MEFNLADLFESVVDVVPDNEALVCGDRRMTYSELDEAANRLGHYLEASGVDVGDHIGTYMHNGAEYVISMLAAFKIRAVPVNVNYRYVEEELRYLFNDADLKAVVAQRRFTPRIAAIAGQCPTLETVLVVDDGGVDRGVDGVDAGPAPASERLPGMVDFADALGKGDPERTFGTRSGEDVFIIYTGGTTGMPKGVMWAHEDVFFAGLTGGNPAGEPMRRPEDLAEFVRGRGGYLTMMPVAPLIHGAAQFATLISLNGGDRVVLQARFDADEIVRLIEQERINTMSIVGDAMARPFADALEADAGRTDVSSLIVISSAGAIFTTAAKDRIKGFLANTILLDNYGSTETGFQGTGTSGEKTSFGAGLAFQMNDRSVVLDDDLSPVEPGSGVVGRVALRGRVPLGYYNDPEKTASTFPVIDGVRHSLTGDMATIEADGSVKLFGRGSICINTGGEKVFVEEVENAIRRHSGVRDAVVVGVPDDRFGERVAALVELEPTGADVDSDAIRAHARNHVAGYKVPRDVHIVEEVFRGPNGKADYRLAKRVATELSAASS